MSISIIICTCNRAEYLRRTLDAMAGVCVTKSLPTEMIVVDNASTDDTAEVVKACRLPGMSVRYVHEPVRGQCHARNSGIAAAHGEIILFTDDDVRPPENWIAGMCRPILAGEADAVAGGVRFAPHLERDWMEQLHRLFLASTENLNPEHPEHLVGANMAFSRAVLGRVPQFDTELGPGALGFYDDTLFCKQFQAAGFRLGGALDTCVEHHFDESRLTHEYFLTLAKRMGASEGYVAHHWAHADVPHARLFLLKRSLRLMSMRLQTRRDNLEVAPIDEIQVQRQISFYKQFLIETKKPRNYEKHGLKKLSHD